jgi:hypothetical protein
MENMSTCWISSLRASYKEEEVKEAKPKGTPRILMPLRGQHNLARGMNPWGKPDGAQIEQLQG